MTSPPYAFIEDLSKQIPEIPPDSIISRTIFSDEQIKTVLFGFAPGQELSEHTSSQSAVLYFVHGEANITLGHDDMRARVGSWIHMPPGLAHRIFAETELVMLLILLKG